jgi:hypothetical protein
MRGTHQNAAELVYVTRHEAQSSQLHWVSYLARYFLKYYFSGIRQERGQE